MSLTGLQLLLLFSDHYTGLKAAVVGNGHTAAAFLHSQTGLLGQQSFPGGRVPRL